MGYVLSSIFAVSPNDDHTYFIYYIPDRSFRNDWVNEWISKQFGKIAENLGPEGVIIAPSSRHDERFLSELIEIGHGGTFFSKAYYGLKCDSDPDGFPGFHAEEAPLHEGSPMLIFSRSPLAKEGEHNVAYLINLKDCQNENELGQILDILIAAVKYDDIDQLEQLEGLLNRGKEAEASTAETILDSLELKPNFCGVGVNFNFLLKKIAQAATRNATKLGDD